MSLVLSMRTSLRQRSTHAVFRSVCVQVIRLLSVDSTKMCRIDHRLFQLVESKKKCFSNALRHTLVVLEIH